MADRFEQLISLQLELQQKGDKDLAAKLAASLEQIGVKAEKAAELSKKAAAARAKGDEEAAQKFERAADRQRAAADRLADKIARDIPAAQAKAAKAAEDASKRQEAAADKTGKSFNKLEGTTDALKNAFASLPGPAGEVASKIEGIASAGNPAAIAIAALTAAIAAGVTATISAGKSFADNAREIENIQKTSGAAALTVTTLLTAFKSIGGEGNDVADVLAQIAQVVAQAKTGAGDAAENLKKLGVTDLSSLDSVVKQLAKGLKDLPPSVEKTAAASQVLGEEGARQFGAVADKIDEYEQKVKDLNLVIDQQSQASADRFNAALADSALNYQALSNAIGKEVLPSLTESVKGVNEIIAALAKSETVKEIFKGFADSIRDVVTVAVQTKNAFKDVKVNLDELIPSFLRGKVAIKDFLNPVVSLLSYLGEGQRAFDEQVEAQRKYEEGLKKAKGPLKEQTGAVEENIEALKKQAKAISDSAEETIKKAKLAADAEILAIRQKGLAEKEEAAAIVKVKQDLADQEVRIRSKVLDDIAQIEREKNVQLTDEITAAENRKQEAINAAAKQGLDERDRLAKEEAKEAQEAKKKESEEFAKSEKEKTEALKEESDKRKAIDDRAKIEQENRIEELQRKNKANNVDDEKTAREVAQIKIDGIKNQIQEREKELQKLREQGAKESEILDKENEILRLKNDLAELQDQLTVKVKETKTAIDENAASQKKVTDEVQETIDKVTELGSKQNSQAEKLADAAQKNALAIGESFDIASLSAEELDEKINTLIESLGTVGLASGTAAQEARQAEIDTLAALQEERARRDAEAARARAAQELAIQQDLANQIAETRENLADRLDEIEDRTLEKRAEIKEKITDLENDYAGDITDINNKLNDTLDDLQEERNERRAAKQKRDNEELIGSVRDAEEEIKEIRQDAKQEDLDRERDFINNRGKLEDDIAKANADLAKAKASGVQKDIDAAQARVDKLAADLKALDSKEGDRKEREKKKQEDLAKINKEFSEKIKNAKNADEVKALQKELEIQKNGINEKYKLEEDYQRDLAELGENASEATKALLKANYDKQIELLNERIAAQQAAEAADAAQRAEARAAEAQAEEDAYNQKVQDAKDRAQEDRDRRKDDYDDQLGDLKDALKDERQAYRDQRDQVIADSQDAANKIADAFGIPRTVIGDLIKDVQGLSAELKGLFSGLSTGAGGSSSSSTTNNTTGGNNNSPFGPPPDQGGTPTILGPTARATPGAPTPGKPGKPGRTPIPGPSGSEPTPGGQPGGGGPQTSAGSTSGGDANSNTGNQPGSQSGSGPTARPGQQSNIGSASDAKSFHKAMAAIYNDHHGNGGPKVYQLIYSKVAEYASAAGAKPQGAILSIITDHGEVQLNSRAGDMATHCGNEAQNKYFNLVDAIIDDVENAAAKNKKVEQADTSGATSTTPAGDLNKTGGKGSKKEGSGRGGGGDKGAGAGGATTSGSGTVGPSPSNEAPNPNKNRVGGADITRGDTQTDQSAINEANASAALRGNGAPGPAGGNLTQTNSTTVNQTFNVTGILGDPRTLSELKKLFADSQEDTNKKNQQRLRAMLGDALVGS